MRSELIQEGNVAIATFLNCKANYKGNSGKEDYWYVGEFEVVTKRFLFYHVNWRYLIPPLNRIMAYGAVNEWVWRTDGLNELIARWDVLVKARNEVELNEQHLWEAMVNFCAEANKQGLQLPRPDYAN